MQRLCGRSQQLARPVLAQRKVVASVSRRRALHEHPTTRGAARVDARRPYTQGVPRPPTEPEVAESPRKDRSVSFIPFLNPGSSAGDAIVTAVIGIGILFIGGVAYIAWYKKRVLDKIELAFAAGYDPALDLANNHAKKAVSSDQTILEELVADGDDLWTAHLRRKEQDALDAIVHGLETGHYFMLLGPKGAGKTTMVIDAMRKNQAEGVAMCDAHPDLEVFRLRLGKALNFEYNEDSQTGVFQRRDPREGGPALDIERAFNKLEKVAIRVSRRTGRPLVLIINNIHHFKNDDEGRNMLLQLQQRAEGWSASGTLTMVFSTDDFWPFHEMRKTASRMHVMYIPDLSNHEAFHAARRMRLDARRSSVSDEEVRRVIGLVGGRLAYLSKVAKARDMEEYAQHMLDVEKGWLLSQIGLIPDCDDDVMDEQKWSSCSWLLLREFVRLRMQQEHELGEQISSGEVTPDGLETLPLPSIPYYKCRQIMTRADFLEDLDRMNIISIDVHHNVQPDSMLILHVARSVVEEDGFDELLDGVRDRIDEIESLHRTRELTFKDLDKGDRIRLAVDKTATILDNDD